MHGNVWEWCQDWHGPYSDLQVVSDPTGPAQGEYRMLRGGAFNLQPLYVRAANRYNGYQPGSRYPNLGFRMARTCNLSP
jgi:formylglycine-generating enzyme required for sulfatase activity